MNVLNKDVLTVSGLGYLDKLTHKNGQTIADICSIDPMIDTTEIDESLWFKGLVFNEAVEKSLTKLLQYNADGNAIKVRFKARYLKMDNFHYCCSEEDPEQIVTLSVELLDVESVKLN